MNSLKSGAAVIATALFLGAGLSPAFAMGDWHDSPSGGSGGNGGTGGGTGTVSQVPEIDAVSGMAALAAVSAALAFAWERRRERDRT